MNNLLDFLRKYHYFFLFILLEVASFAPLFYFNNYQGSVWYTSANRVTASIDRFYGDVQTYLNLQHVNRKLTDHNIQLQRQIDVLRERLADLDHDSTETERLVAKSLEGYRLIPAKVISSTLVRRNNYLVIDRGAKDGIRPEMGVVSGGGVVGIVFLTGPNYSLVLPAINARSSISCRIRNHRFFGYLQWDGGSPIEAYVSDIPRYARLKVGEVIETSGYSSIFPPGIFVGRIRAIHNAPDGVTYRLDVTLGTDFGRLRDVTVIATENRAEIDTLRVHALQSEQAI